MTRIGLPPKQLHFGTSGTMLVQICHCRVDHGMLLACARHVPPSAKPAEIGVQPRCPIFGIVEESEIFAPGQLVDLGNCIDCPKPCLRSEEHTSELQSLMRISYAVFCLKKTNKQ